ncbi:MAG: TOBE domain-containing protein, partial [Kiloniellales bacterium]|nr:TOBE domain-containing protein [Kiloniellales bacterium]
NLIECKAVAADGGMNLIAGEQSVSIPALSGIAANDNVTFGARPEHIEIVDEADADVVATLDLSEQLGGETYLYCSADGLPQLTVHQLGQLPVQRGQQIHLRFNRECVHLFNADGRVIANGIA